MKRVGWLAIVASVIGGIACFALLIGGVASSVVDIVNSPTFAIPGETTRQLAKGNYVVYELSPTQSTGAVSINPSQVSVTAADGSKLAVRGVTGNQNVTRNQSTFGGAAQFDVPAAGLYTIAVNNDQPGEAIVAKGLLNVGRKALGPVLGMLVSALVFIAGIVMAVRGRKRKEPQMAPTQAWMPPANPPMGSPMPPTVLSAQTTAAAAAPGWYPTGTGEIRWWDGATWTDHIQPIPGQSIPGQPQNG